MSPGSHASRHPLAGSASQCLRFVRAEPVAGGGPGDRQRPSAPPRRGRGPARELDHDQRVAQHLVCSRRWTQIRSCSLCGPRRRPFTVGRRVRIGDQSWHSASLPQHDDGPSWHLRGWRHGAVQAHRHCGCRSWQEGTASRRRIAATPCGHGLGSNAESQFALAFHRFVDGLVLAPRGAFRHQSFGVA